jgi:hypothetical protein
MQSRADVAKFLHLPPSDLQCGFTGKFLPPIGITQIDLSAELENGEEKFVRSFSVLGLRWPKEPLKVTMRKAPPTLTVRIEAEDSNANAPSDGSVRYKIALKNLGPYALMHSLAASPARYIEEALKRESRKGDRCIAIFNPIFSFSEETHSSAHQLLSSSSNENLSVYTSDDNKPILYVFPPGAYRQVALKREWLWSLTTLDAELDVQLLSKLFNQKVFVHFLSGKHHSGYANHFHIDSTKDVLIALARRALECLNKATHKSAPGVLAVTHHAGDVLFSSMAIRLNSGPFTKLIVHRDYSATARLILSENNIHIVDGPRFGYVSHGKLNCTDSDYFLKQVLPALPQNAPAAYGRQVREYRDASFHLIDQWRFALGHGFEVHDSNHYYKIFSRKAAPISEKSVLLHFDGGWPLKIYPFGMQLELGRALTRSGFRVSVLTGKLTDYPWPAHQFTNLSSLETLILDHSILVGMDSFPVHFSTHILNHPTLCLFSSTRPENSNARESIRYKQMSLGMVCCPCGSHTSCFVYTEDKCHNFSPPEAVVKTIINMYEKIKFNEE